MPEWFADVAKWAGISTVVFVALRAVVRVLKPFARLTPTPRDDELLAKLDSALGEAAETARQLAERDAHFELIQRDLDYARQRALKKPNGG